MTDKKPRPGRIPGAAVQYRKRYEVNGRDKDREFSKISEIPYFFLPVVGFSLYPDAYMARAWASACCFVG